MNKSELIALLERVPDDAEIEASDGADVCPEFQAKLELEKVGDNKYYLVGVYEYVPPKFNERQRQIAINGQTFKCTNGGCGCEEFTQYAPAAFRCNTCGCAYVAP